MLNGFNDALERKQDYQKQLDVLVSRKNGRNGGLCNRNKGEVACEVLGSGNGGRVLVIIIFVFFIILSRWFFTYILIISSNNNIM